MKHALVVILLMSSLAHAEPLKVKVENFNFSYTNPAGEGSATSFYRNQFMNDEVFVKVDKIENNFRLLVTGAEQQEFELKDAPSFMTNAETMNVNSFNLNLDQGASLSLAAGRFNSSEDALSLDGVSLNCAREASQPELMDQLILGCINSMSLKASKFAQSELKKVLTSLFTEKADMKITSVDVRTSGGKYDLGADVKAQISGRVKSNGNMSYDPSTGTATIKISEVKFGFLNITGKVFDELKKKESEKLKVKQPYVYYKLK